MCLIIEVTRQETRRKTLIMTDLVCVAMLPVTILVPNGVGNLFGHKDGTNGGIPIIKSEQVTTRDSERLAYPPPRPFATAWMSGGSLSPKLSQAWVVPIPISNSSNIRRLKGHKVTHDPCRT